MLEKKKGLLMNLLKYTLVLIVTVILLVVSIAFINDKINGSRGKVGSFSVRMDDYRIGFEVLNDYKLHGVGFLNNDFVKRNYMNLSERGTDAGGSNSIMIILSQGGLYLSVIYLLSIISFFIKSLKYKQKNLLVFNITIVLLMAVTNVPYTSIILIYIAMGLTSCINDENFI